MTTSPQYGLQIRAVRKAHHLTQEELASKAGIAVNSLRRYESNLRYPSVDILQKLADALGITLGEFLWSDKQKSISTHDWLYYFEQKLIPIGFSIDHDEKDAYLWVKYPDGSTQEVSENDLKALHDASNAFLRFQLEELKGSK